MDEQLGALTDEFRSRLMANLGIRSVLCDPATPSRVRGRDAALRALGNAGLGGSELGLIIDFRHLPMTRRVSGRFHTMSSNTCKPRTHSSFQHEARAAVDCTWP